MLSILLYGRNDSYGALAQRRSALSINTLADVLGDEDEIVFVDYNTDDHKLTFIEAIADTLSERAHDLVRCVRVRPRQHEALCLPHAGPVVESVARNIGLRYTNPANRWVLSTNPDIILMPPATGLAALLSDLDDGYYAAPRFELPRMLWQCLPRQNPVAVRDAVMRFAAPLHLDEEVRHYLPAIGFDAPGDFQLALRSDLIAIGGFDEQMQRAWHVDANLMARLGLKYGAPRSLGSKLRIYHCEHTADTMAKHSSGRGEDSFEIHVEAVREIAANEGEAWGGLGHEFETFSLADWSAMRTATIVANVIDTKQTEPNEAIYGPESFGTVDRRDAHTLTFIADRLFPLARSARIAWLGNDTALRVNVDRLLQKLSFAHRLAIDPDDGTLASAELILFDNHAPDASIEDKRELDRHITRLTATETSRQTSGKAPRDVIVINAINSDLETFLLAHFDVVLCPFTTRLRPARLKSAQANLGSWLDALFVGDAGQRSDDGASIEFRKGVPGHIFHGPYKRLLPGRYEVTVEWERISRGTGRLVLEIVRGDEYLAQVDCALRDGSKCLGFTIPEPVSVMASEGVQVRLWTDGRGAGSVGDVQVSETGMG